MVEVFKTNIQDSQLAANVISELKTHFPNAIINFDLTDCDNILRFEYEENIIEKIMQVLHKSGHVCEVLVD